MCVHKMCFYYITPFGEKVRIGVQPEDFQSVRAKISGHCNIWITLNAGIETT